MHLGRLLSLSLWEVYDLILESRDPDKYCSEDAGLTWTGSVLALVNMRVLIPWVWAKPRNLHHSQVPSAAATQHQLFPLRVPGPLFIFCV